MSKATSSSKSPVRSRGTRRSGGRGLLRAAFVRLTLPVATLHTGPAGWRAG